MPIDCLKSSSYGEQWRNTIRGIFDSRIKSGAISIFNNGENAIRTTPAMN